MKHEKLEYFDFIINKNMEAKKIATHSLIITASRKKVQFYLIYLTGRKQYFCDSYQNSKKNVPMLTK